MEKRWIICASIAAAAFVSACGGDDTVTPQEIPPVPYCDTAQCPKGTTCNEERRMCVSDAPGVVETNPCDKCTEEQECVNKTCVDKEPPLELCSETDAPTCNGNAVVSCVNGELVPMDCEDKVCKDGECVEIEIEDPNACDPVDFVLYCDGDSVVSCVENQLKTEPCPEGHYCDGGECYDTDYCPDNPDKMAPGVCGCAMVDADLDGNGNVDCLEVGDLCPDDSDKTHPGQCGCGIPEGTCDGDMCPDNPAKTVPGICGCDAEDADSDHDGIPDCIDKCPDNPYKFLDDGCACDRVHVSIDETNYCAIPIVNAQGFVDIINGIADASLEVTSDTVYALVRDINLADVITEETEWKPVTFSGKLTSGGNIPRTIAYTNADGERLSLHCADTDTLCGLFGTLAGARIHNINLNLGVSGIKSIGGLAGLANTDTKLTHIQANTDITASGSDVGGVIGFGSKISLDHITHQGKIVNIGENTTANPVSNTGGILGRLSDNSVMSDSVNKGRVVSESENLDTAAYYLGGLIGRAESNTKLFDLTNDSVVASVTTHHVGGIVGRHFRINDSGMKNLTNNGYVKGYNYTGGLFGYIDKISSAEGIIESTNNGTVAGLWSYTGGIVGQSGVPLKYVSNHGTVTGSTVVGGISGQQDNRLDHVYNDGMVWSENASQGCSSSLGGIVGYLTGGFKHTHLTNHGKIVADWAPNLSYSSVNGLQQAGDCPNQNWGGIAGYIIGGGTVMENILNTGTLSTSASGLSRCGGIAGWAHSVNLVNARNTGDIKGGSLVGGIFGRFGMRGTAASKGIPFEMKNVENTGNILSGSTTGGIIGTFDMDYEKAEFTFDQVVNRGNVSCTGTTIGGIFGAIYTHNQSTTYKNLYNYGTIKGAGYVGGIAGQFIGTTTGDWWEGEAFSFTSTGPRTMTNTFDSCVSTGDIISKGNTNYLGGLFGAVGVPTVAAYAHTSNHAYRTSACKNNTSIYKRVIDLTYYDVHSVFNIQNSYFSGNVSETGTAAYFGGLIGYLDSSSLYSAFTNTDYDFDNDCKATPRTTTLSPVARLSQTNIRNSYAIGSVTSDHDYTGSLVGRMDTEDLVPNPNAYKNQIIGEGKSVMSSLTNVYSAVTLANKGSAVSGYNNNKTYLTVNGVYTWSGASSSNLVWGNATSLPGHASYSFNDAGEAMVGSDKLITKLNATASSLGLSAWKETSYTMPDSKSVKIPSFDLKPQLTEWDSWEGK